MELVFTMYGWAVNRFYDVVSMAKGVVGGIDIYLFDHTREHYIKFDAGG